MAEQIDPRDEVRQHPAVLYGPSFDFVIEQRGHDFEATVAQVVQDHVDLVECDVVRHRVHAAFELLVRQQDVAKRMLSWAIDRDLKPKPITALSLRATRVKRLLTAGLK